MSHAAKATATAAGTVLAALAHLGWPPLGAIGIFVTAGAGLLLRILSDQARSDRAAALLAACRGTSKHPEPAQIAHTPEAGTPAPDPCMCSRQGGHPGADAGK